MKIGDTVFIILDNGMYRFICPDRPQKITRIKYKEVLARFFRGKYLTVECYQLNNSECTWYPWELELNWNNVNGVI
jgi:hypothetical protein